MIDLPQSPPNIPPTNKNIDLKASSIHTSCLPKLIPHLQFFFPAKPYLQNPENPQAQAKSHESLEDIKRFPGGAR